MESHGSEYSTPGRIRSHPFHNFPHFPAQVGPISGHGGYVCCLWLYARVDVLLLHTCRSHMGSHVVLCPARRVHCGGVGGEGCGGGPENAVAGSPGGVRADDGGVSDSDGEVADVPSADSKWRC